MSSRRCNVMIVISSGIFELKIGPGIQCFERLGKKTTAKKEKLR